MKRESVYCSSEIGFLSSRPMNSLPMSTAVMYVPCRCHQVYALQPCSWSRSWLPAYHLDRSMGTVSSCHGRFGSPEPRSRAGKKDGTVYYTGHGDVWLENWSDLGTGLVPIDWDERMIDFCSLSHRLPLPVVLNPSRTIPCALVAQFAILFGYLDLLTSPQYLGSSRTIQHG